MILVSANNAKIIRFVAGTTAYHNANVPESFWSVKGTGSI